MKDFVIEYAEAFEKFDKSLVFYIREQIFWHLLSLECRNSAIRHRDIARNYAHLILKEIKQGRGVSPYKMRYNVIHKPTSTVRYFLACGNGRCFIFIFANFYSKLLMKTYLINIVINFMRFCVLVFVRLLTARIFYNIFYTFLQLYQIFVQSTQKLIFKQIYLEYLLFFFFIFNLSLQENPCRKKRCTQR